MKYEKSIATFLAALMSLVSVVYPVLAATNLGQYPGFLLNSDGSLGAYVVVGASANSQDVIGATDLAARLAQAAAVTTNVPGTSAAINGLEKNTIDINWGNLSANLAGPFPDPIRNFHYSGLLQGTISYKGNTYNYHEALALGDTYFSHDFGTSGINGTETMVVHSNQVKYQYVFDSALNCTALSTTAQNTCTLSSLEYTNPVKINLLGKPFVIVGVGSNQVVMLSGSVGTATATSGVTFGSYTVYSDLGNNGNWARVVIKDASGNTVETKVINQGDSFDFTAENITVKLTAARALQDGTVVGTDVVVGSISAVQKTYTTSCDVTSTGSSDTKFPGETNWCIQVAGFAGTAPGIAVGDEIDVVYKPSTSPQYMKYTGSVVTLPLPNSYGEIGFEGWNYNTFATLTMKVVEGISGYHMIGGGATNSSVAASNLNGIEIDSDTTGSIVDPNTGTGYTRAYVLFSQTVGGSYPVLFGFYDSTNSRVGVTTTGCGVGGLNDYCANFTGVDGVNTTAFKFTISYGGGANLADRQYLYVQVNPPYNATACQAGGACTSLFANFQLGTVADRAAVIFSWANKTGTWTASQPPSFRLYTTDSAEENDILVHNTPSGGGAVVYSAIGKASQDVVADSGAIVLAPSSYTAGNQVVVKVPAQALAVKAYVGKTGGAGTAAGTYQQIVPITQSIAKLDSEITAADEAAKDLVIVGGPCVNTLVASLATASGNATAKFPYTCASWPARNFGRIQVIDDAFVTGHQVVVIAGTRAADTRLAANVLQQYDTLLSGQTASAVEVTSLSASGITPA
jgi:hypothetical protein